MIYRLPPGDEPVAQGDLVENCPVAFVAGFHPAHVEAVEFGCEMRRVLVMTQTCDLANRKTTLATVAVIHDAHSLVALFGRPASMDGPATGITSAGRIGLS